MLGNIACTPAFAWPLQPDGFIIANDGGTVNYSLDNGVLSIDDNAYKKFLISWSMIDRINGVQVFCPATPVKQKNTVTTAVVPNADCCGEEMCYSVTIEWKDLTNTSLTPWQGADMKKSYKVCFDTGTTTTKTQVSAALIAKINADPQAIVVATAVGETLVLEAKTAGQPFKVTVDGVNQTQAQTTANVVGLGSGESFEPYHFGSSISVDNDYITVMIPYFEIHDSSQPDIAGNTSSMYVIKRKVLWLIVESGGTAEDTILGTTNATGLCKILTGQYTPAAEYNAVTGMGCPCS